MKGITFTERGVAEFTDEPEPECGDDQILFRTLYSGLSNGTERSFLVGGPYGGNKWPNRIAYLHVSEILEIGEDVERFEPGDIVYTGSTKPGHVERYTLPEDDLIVALSDDLDRPSAAMLGLAGVSYFNTHRVDVGESERVLVTGAGAIGLMALQSARSMGAHVTLASRTPERRSLGREMGADAVFDPVDQSSALFAAGPYDVLLECAGTPLDTFTEPPDRLLARFARVALIAGRERVDYRYTWASFLRLAVYQSSHFDQPTLEKVAALSHAGTLDLQALVRDVVPVDDAIGIYDTLRDHPMTLGGTVFDWTSEA